MSPLFLDLLPISVQFSRSVRVWLFATPWITAHQAYLSITNSWSPSKPMPIELVMPSSHLILCSPLLLLPPILPSIRVFPNESILRMRWPKYWTFSFNISPSNEGFESIDVSEFTLYKKSLYSMWHNNRIFIQMNSKILPRWKQTHIYIYLSSILRYHPYCSRRSIVICI